jgi:multidrug efflux pump subunit AcrA (membrane-fusion protein)
MARDPATSSRNRARQRSRRQTVIGAAALVVVVAGAGVAWASTRSSGPRYRLSVAATASVAQTVTSVGTISSVNEATLAFPVSGQVASVGVAIGDSVAAGQAVATLSTTSLEQQVQSEQASVASAQQSLASDETSQVSAATTTTTTTTTESDTSTQLSTDSDSDALVSSRGTAGPTGAPAPTGTASPPSRPGSGGSAPPVGSCATLKACQTTVQNAQKTLTDAVTTLNESLPGDVTALQDACAPTTSTTPPITFQATPVNATLEVTWLAPNPVVTIAPTSAPGSTSPPTSTDTLTGAYTFSGLSSQQYTVTVTPGSAVVDQDVAQTCASALTDLGASAQATSVQAEANTVQADVTALATAITNLNTQVAKSGSTSTRPSGSSTSGSATRGGVASGSGGSSSGSTSTKTTGGATGSGSTAKTITAQQIAADQASIDAANAELAVAQQNLAQAELKSPIAGTVAAVSLSAGDSVSASSTTKTITVIGAGQKEVNTTVGIADIDLIRPGESVQVTVDGVSTPLPGKVTLIGVLNTSGTSGTTTTYPVTVVLDPTTVTLFDGAGATVAIAVGTASNVLTVPISAVHALGTLATVDILKAGKLSVVRVTTGVVGLDVVQIKSGLTAGEKVVVADLSESVPTTTTTTTGRGLGGTGLGGTGLGGGTGGGGRSTGGR